MTLQVTQGHISLYLSLDENMRTSLSQWGTCIHALYHSSLSPFRCGKVCTFLSQWYVTICMGQGVYISVPWSVTLQIGRCVRLSVSHWPVTLQMGQSVHISITVVCHPSGGARCAHLCHSGQSNKSCLICEEVKSLFVAKTLFCCQFTFESAVLSSSCLLKLIKRP